MTDTKERPILFSAPMVRALLDGSKTQTRRAMRPQPPAHTAAVGRWQDPPGYDAAWWAFVREGPVEHDHPFAGAEIHGEPWRCPYGKPGDTLWVREAWGYFDPDGSGEDYDRDRNDDGKAGPCKAYRAEMMQEGNTLRDYWRRRIAYKATFAEQKYGMGPAGPNRWRPSIHMPRWASRITLEVTDVRVEKLTEISEVDAQAEGVGPLRTDGRMCNGLPATDGYADLWESINGPGSWEANPWVWAVSFRRIK